MKKTLLFLTLFFSLSVSAAARDFDIFFSAGKSPMNFHGHSVFKTITFEFADDASKFAGHRPARWIPKRWLNDTDFGASVSYHDIRQARSWFGYRYGDPNDSVRGESLYLFVRHRFRAGSPTIKPFIDIGTGPMWANRRVPAATSRFNFSSQLGLGVTLFPNARTPIMAGYRFAHISNGLIASRNPGLEVSSLFIGTRVRMRR
jgi:hypothetical protein